MSVNPSAASTHKIHTLHFHSNLFPSAAGDIFELPGHRHDTARAPAAALILYTIFSFELFLFSYVRKMVNKRVKFNSGLDRTLGAEKQIEEVQSTSSEEVPPLFLLFVEGSCIYICLELLL